jgi:cytidylate kinase
MTMTVVQKMYPSCKVLIYGVGGDSTWHSICDFLLWSSSPEVLLMDRSLAQLVEKACRHWEARQRAAAAQRNLPTRASPTFTITLSREVGTLGTAIAREAGKLLGWQVYDHELLDQIAQDMGLRTSLLESVDERQQSWFLEMVEAFLSAPREGDWGPLVTESGYVHHLVKTVLVLGVHGECIIVERGAAFILPVATTLRVRLVGPARERIVALARALGISEPEAARKVRTMDRERTDFVRDHFLKDPTDPRNYDLVLNALRLPGVQSAELIVAALRRLEAYGRAGNARKTHS